MLESSMKTFKASARQTLESSCERDSRYQRVTLHGSRLAMKIKAVA